MNPFRCPICKKSLFREEHRFFCENGHSFDVAAEGYVHLLLPNKMNSKIPGDSKEMASSRSDFLNKGYYEPLAKALFESLTEKFGENPFSVLDCGCGEGYYTDYLYSSLKKAGYPITMAGVDISRPSVKKAAKRNKEIAFAVASVFDLPAEDEAWDAVLNIFSPLCREEYARVLKSGGLYYYVVPAPRHLWQMKEILYDRPYENKEEDIPYEGFEHRETIPVRYEITLFEKTDIASLFQMTPYYWKTSAKGAEKLSACNSLTTEVAFNIHIYEKI